MAGGQTSNTSSNEMSQTNENKTATSMPAPWAEGPLKDITANATSIYGDGSINPDIAGAWDQIKGIAGQSNPLYNATNTGLTTLAQNGGLNALQLSDSAALTKLSRELNGQSASEQNLQQYANGSLLGHGNPYMDKMLATTDQQVANRVNGQYAGAGRVGGGANAQDLARALSENENATRYADYNNQVQNQFNANQAIDSAHNARLGLRSNIIGQQAGIGQAGNVNLAGIAALNPMMDSMRYAGADRLLGVGSAEQTAPWQNLSNYLSTVRGASNGYGTQNTVGTSTTMGRKNSETETSGQSGLQTGLGGIMTVGGLAKSGMGK